ncbi:hypothetical protein MASR2M15_04200 [Anaerolineales bacterium]
MRKIIITLIALIVVIAVIGLVVALSSNTARPVPNVALNQTLSASEQFGGVITVAYPDGWAAEGQDTGVILSPDANILSALKNGDENNGPVLFLQVFPADQLSLFTGKSRPTTQELLSSLMDLSAEHEDTVYGELENYRLGDKEGARVKVSDAASEGWLIAIPVNDAAYLIATVVSPTGTLSALENSVEAIIYQVQYQ